jgi:transposase
MSNLQEVIFQQDGAPPHWEWDVREYLNAILPGCLIDHRGPIPLPPLSPDINPLHFLWGYIKDIVCSRKAKTTEDMKERIINSLATVDESMLERT